MAELLKRLALILAEAGVDAVRKALKSKPARGLPYADVKLQQDQIRKATEHVGK